MLQTFGQFGSSNAYPKGLDVGVVKESATPQAGRISVEVEPLADLDRVEFVAVIPWPPDPASTEPEEEPETVPLDEDGNPIPPEDADTPEGTEGEPTETAP